MVEPRTSMVEPRTSVPINIFFNYHREHIQGVSPAKYQWCVWTCHTFLTVLIILNTCNINFIVCILMSKGQAPLTKWSSLVSCDTHTPMSVRWHKIHLVVDTSIFFSLDSPFLIAPFLWVLATCGWSWLSSILLSWYFGFDFRHFHWTCCRLRFLIRWMCMAQIDVSEKKVKTSNIFSL